MTTIPQSNTRMEFRLPSEWKEVIERAALVQNRSLTDFAIAILTDAARKVLAEHERQSHIQLSNRDRDRFLAMLEANPAPNRALKAAAQRHRQRVA